MNESILYQMSVKREMKVVEPMTMESGTPATQGVCSLCETKMLSIGRTKSNYYRILRRPDLLHRNVSLLLLSHNLDNCAAFHFWP